MSLTNEQILNALSEMSVQNISQLITEIEKKFNVSSVISLDTMNSTPVKKIEEKTEFNVKLNEIGSNKVSVIKIIRSVTGLGLKESKDLVESAPTLIKEKITKQEAEQLVKDIVNVGAKAEIQ
ncbi:50S ribosomal protein L12 [Buchnera aphidicola (Cinara tujafilina)]|uniref:Large ribosomal subunit protein bL12 n=1 Tax=Buchnera aphidicola (Cinara tujafilina) TaxID=261317 RepID=F7WYW9_9GAMM|nr:50S ribosomal protein L7/L12 [Buchnera aphidicola]AEH39619.1 50S ribosomal protein L12 [Buchnera aphidicola (Cinara tujafilina)]